MAAMTSLALVGAVPITAEEHERSRLLPFVHQLLSCELVRRVLGHWTPPEPPEVADAATSVTEAELAAAAAGGRTGPPPDLVTCHRERSPAGDLDRHRGREPTMRQLRVRLERLQAVRRAAQQETPTREVTDLGQRSLTPPAAWSSSQLRLCGEDAAEEADDEEDEEEDTERRGGRSGLRHGIGRELVVVADRLDVQHAQGAQAKNQKTEDNSPPMSGVPGGIASTAVTACGLAALGLFVRQMSLSDG